MTKIWSEMPVARLKEQVADLATLLWVVFWGNLVWQLFQLLAGFAQAGRTIHSGGQGMNAALLGPLLAGSLERGLNLAEAMEARGYGRPGRTRLPAPAWGRLDHGAIAAAAVVVAVGALWL